MKQFNLPQPPSRPAPAGVAAAPADPSQDWRQGPGLVRSIWQGKYVVVALALVCGLLAYWVSLGQQPQYEATGELLLSDPNLVGLREVRGTVDPARHAIRESERLLSPGVRARASELLNGQRSPENLATSALVEPAEDVEAITITGRDLDPGMAAEKVNALAEAYRLQVEEDVAAETQAAVERLSESQTELDAELDEVQSEISALPAETSDLVLETRLRSLTDRLSNIGDRANELAVNAALFGAGIEIYQPAAVPEEPATSSPANNGLFGAVLGFLVGSVYAYWRAGRKQVVESRNDPASVLGVPLLGAIPQYRTRRRSSSAWVLSDLGSPASEAYQFVAASIDFALEESGGNTVLITSSAPKEGKTTTTLALATAANRTDRPVTMVDADTRVRRLSTLARAESRRGLPELARSEADLTASLAWLPTRLAPDAPLMQLPLVPAGSHLPDPAGFFRTSAFRKALQRVKDASHLVIIDAPPVLAVSDTSAIAGQVDAVVLLVDLGTPIARLQDVRRRLEFVGAPLIGYVLNREHRRHSEDPYGYAYGMESDRERRRLSTRFATVISRLRPRRQVRPPAPQPRSQREPVA